MSFDDNDLVELKEFVSRTSNHEVTLTCETIRALLTRLEAVEKAAVPLLAQMKLINGDDDNCIISDSTYACKNHSAIRQMEEALKQ